MKITFVLPYAGLTGGIRVIAIYAAKLQNLGHEVLVVSQPKKQPNLRNQLRSVLEGKGWISQTKGTPSHFDHVNVAHHVIESSRPITDDDIPDADVVIATWWETAEWVAQLAPSKGCKVYFIQHHEIHNYLPQARAEATYKLPLFKITIAQWLVQILSSKYNNSEVALVPNSVDAKLFSASPRSKQPIPTIGMMYSQRKWKGSDISIAAFSLAQDKIDNIRLIAFGQESSPNFDLPPNSEYLSLPPQKTIKDIYARCDAWLFGSRYEGFGLPILEAMACRTPVIGTPAGAAPELISKGGGILVKSEDPEDMARAIVQICNSSNAEWQSMSQIAYTTATSYTWDDATKLFETALYSAIESSKSGKLANSS